MSDLASRLTADCSSISNVPHLSLIVTPRLLQYRMSSGAFLTAQYHATPLSHSRQRLRLRVCFWLAPFLS